MLQQIRDHQHLPEGGDREDKAKFEFTWNGVEIGSIDRSQFLINFAV